MKNGIRVALVFIIMLCLMQAWGCTSNVAGPNRPPVAAAGTDQETEVNLTVVLDGSDSFDPDGDELSVFQWDMLAMPDDGTANLVNADNMETQLTPDAAGVWIAALTVTDSNGSVSDRDVVQIRVEEPCEPEQEGPYGDDTCYDGVDNDCDNLTDGYDDDCQCAEDVDCEDNEICVEGDCVPDPCLGELCSNHGSCDSSSGEKVCVCDTGYAGVDCSVCDIGYQDNDGNGTCLMACANPDLNLDCGHGDCTDVSGTPRCECNEGWAGPNCSTCAAGYHDDGLGNCILDQECAQPNPRASCNMHGDCDDSSGAVVCTCDPAYAGPTCAVCATDYQDNDMNGICLMACSHPSSPLNCGDHGSCSDATGQAFCVCDTGYAGINCSVCDIGYQDNDNNGTCLVDCANSGLNCGDHGSCSDASGFILCVCDLGYAGVLCGQCDPGYQDNDGDTICMPNCATSGLTCSNGGSCSDAGGEALCICINNWDPGFNCQQCLSGYQDNDGDIICLPDCATAELAGLDCGGYGQCEDTSGTAVCVCDLGYTGADCSSCDTNYQDNDGNGTCLPNCAISGLTCNAQGGGHCEDTSGTAVCVCDVGYHEQGGTCVPDNPCEGNLSVDLDGVQPTEINFGDGNYYIRHFVITAGVSKDDVVQRLRFRLDLNSVQVTDIILFRGATNLTSGGTRKATAVLTNVSAVQTNLTIFFYQEEVVAAGTAESYSVMAFITGAQSGDSLSVTQLKDDAPTPSLLSEPAGYIYHGDPLEPRLFAVADGLSQDSGPNFVFSCQRGEPGYVYPTINPGGTVTSNGSPHFSDGYAIRDQITGVTNTVTKTN